MFTKFQTIGFLFATLFISGVALAQQGGGGSGGGQGGDTGGGDNSVIAVRLQDHERVRVPGAVRRRDTTANCLTTACNEPPNRGRPELQVADACGGEYSVARDRSGRIVRRICQFN